MGDRVMRSGPGINSRGTHTPWLVRIRSCDAPDTIIGSGVLLGGDTVLTCAHVLGTRGTEVTVDFPEIEGAASSTATPLDNCWIPKQQPHRGDLALLTVDRPPPGKPSAPLLRTAPSVGLRVEMCGYAHGVMAGQGAAFEATVSRRFGERVQLNPVHVPRRGFSGGPVLDMNEPSSVLGITVTRFTDHDGPEPLALAYMIPVDTIVKYLPDVDKWATGRRGVEPGIASRASVAPLVEVDYAQRLADWLRGDTPVYVTEVERGSARDLTLQRALALADRELSAEEPVVLSTDPRATVPPVGSLDLAVDATDKTAADVARQVAERMNLKLPDPAQARERLGRDEDRMSLTIAVLGVNRAAAPRELIALCGDLAERGCRQLLVFHGNGAPERRTVKEELVLLHRMGELAERLSRLGEQGERLSRAASRLAGVTPLDGTVEHLWEDLARARHVYRSSAVVTPGQMHAELDSLAGRTTSTEATVTVVERTVDHLYRERSALRQQLHAYQILVAAQHDRVEDIEVELTAEYREAYGALYAGRFAPESASAAVSRYVAAARRALGWPPAEEEP